MEAPTPHTATMSTHQQTTMTSKTDEETLKTAIAQAEQEKEDGKTGDCCLCDGRYENWGNNPAPLVAEWDHESKCCHKCNETKVIPARMVELFKKDYLKKRLAEAKAYRKLAGRR